MPQAAALPLVFKYSLLPSGSGALVTSFARVASKQVSLQRILEFLSAGPPLA
ncbi:MAG TPA: hypothetical protein VKB88_39990 [Bryobacteraceae bacterium]|nr:hypothetical protein [Bryobacteraceae bacterium]